MLPFASPTTLNCLDWGGRGLAGGVARAEVTWGRGRVHCQVLQEAQEEEEEEEEGGEAASRSPI